MRKIKKSHFSSIEICVNFTSMFHIRLICKNGLGHVLLFSRAPKISNNFTARSTYLTLAKVEPHQKI